jgi:CheY-like chemotaxis protein
MPHEAAEKLGGESRYRLLIVDDEESMRLLLARIVSKGIKADVQLAGTCEQALRLAEHTVYDAILLDLLMPGIGGLGVLAEIRRNTPNAATPVIVVSQVTEKESIDRCMVLGANAYHAKPVRRAELVETVKAQLAARAAKATHG